MATAAKNDPHPVAALKLPKNHASLLVTYARSIVRAMTNNPFFPSPRPPLATVLAAVDALAQAETATLSGLVGTVSERNDKRFALERLLHQLRDDVQMTADGDPDRGASIIESAGLAVKKKAGPPPRTFVVKHGRVSGSVLLRAPKAGNRTAYEWQHSTDGMQTWASGLVTVQATATVDGLAPGSKAYFRFRTTTKDGPSDWSDPVAIIVT